MPFTRGTIFRNLFFAGLFVAALGAPAQTGNAGAVRGTVTDPSGAVIAGATVTLNNATSSLTRTATTDATGQFAFLNIPFNPYRVSVSAPGFAPLSQSAEIRSTIGINLKLVVQIAAAASTVTVETGGDLVETDSTFHTDVDRELMDKLPMENESSGLSSLVTQSTPGISADSDGQMHGLGDHAENSYSWTASRLPTSRAKFSRIRFRSIQCNRLR